VEGIKTLKDSLKEWEDWDGVEYKVARCLGIIDKDKSFQETKGLWWSGTLTGELVWQIIQNLVSEGVLERREEPDIQYRWAYVTNPEDE